VRSTGTDEIYHQGVDPLLFGDVCPKGHQLRPHVVWFGEQVPNLSMAHEIISLADILIVTGTSLNVYPAAGLIHAANDNAAKYLVDPSNQLRISKIKNLTVIKEKATFGIPKVAQLIKNLL
jgi:NAD-dependent deacetylase